jgi:hypothetical protein
MNAAAASAAITPRALGEPVIHALARATDPSRARDGHYQTIERAVTVASASFASTACSRSVK